MKLTSDMKVKVYRNLHSNTWSVINMRTGHVCMHADHVVLYDATFHVQPAGNARVRAEGVKNVHAYVKGTLYTLDEGLVRDVQVKYNPYRMRTFEAAESGNPVYDARWAEFTADGALYVSK